MKTWLVLVLLTRIAFADGTKSPEVAAGLSVGITAAGLGLAITANRLDDHGHDKLALATGLAGAGMLLVGPTSGHIYAGRAWNGGLKWRLISGATFFACAIPGFALGMQEGSGDDAAPPVFLVGAAIAFVTYGGATLYEMSTASSAARAYNLRVTPLVGNQTQGLAVFGSF